MNGAVGTRHDDFVGRDALADPTRPAVLLASDPGQPVYERMGYLRIARFTAWMGARQ